MNPGESETESVLGDLDGDFRDLVAARRGHQSTRSVVELPNPSFAAFPFADVLITPTLPANDPSSSINGRGCPRRGRVGVCRFDRHLDGIPLSVVVRDQLRKEGCRPFDVLGGNVLADVRADDRFPSVAE